MPRFGLGLLSSRLTLVLAHLHALTALPILLRCHHYCYIALDGYARKGALPRGAQRQGSAFVGAAGGAPRALVLISFGSNSTSRSPLLGSLRLAHPAPLSQRLVCAPGRSAAVPLQGALGE